jgi:VanZ family protein
VKHLKRFLAIEGRLLLVLSVVLISRQALLPAAASFPGMGLDKVLHFLAFFLLSFLVDFAFQKTTFNVRKIIVLLVYGIAIEVAQSFFPYRTCSFGDIAADAAGIAGYLLAIPILKRIPFIRERWSA